MTMAQMIEKVDAGDVCILRYIPPTCEYCEEARAFAAGEYVEVPATKIVRIDFREMGHSVVYGKFCDKCAEEVSARLRTSLPKETK